MLFNNLQLQVNLQKLRSDKMLTPELSKKNSLNNSAVMEEDSQAQITEAHNYDIPAIQLTVGDEDDEMHANSGKMKSTERIISASEIDKIRLAFGAKQQPINNSNLQTPEPSARDTQSKTYDEEDARERVLQLIKEHFKGEDTALATSLDYYRLIKMIGKGSFGKVYLGKHILTGQPVAIKSIDKQHMKDEYSRRKIFQEVLILKTCNHKNVIKLLEVFENKKYLFIVQEYASEGDLLSHVKQHGRLSESEAKGLVLQIVQGVRYCHQHNILHRDIKLENILLDKGQVVKICDFGVSRFIKSGQFINEQCGTPAYIAPEIVLDKGYEGCYADLWSLGVLIYATVTGMVPFTGDDIDELHNSVLSGKYSFPNFLSEEAKDFISRFLKLDPYSRIDIQQAENHAWFDSVKKYAEKSMSNALSSTKQAAVSDKRRGSKQELDALKQIKEDQNAASSFKIDPAIVKRIVALGFPKEHVIHSVENNTCSHASACYFLLQKIDNHD